MKQTMQPLRIRSCILLLISIFSTEAKAQKTIEIHPVTEAIKIDGTVTETDWQTHLQDGNFIQTRPENGAPSKRKSKIAVLYDQSYRYIAAAYFVENKADINNQLTARDDVGNAGVFGLQIDPFGEAREGFDFSVTAAGCKTIQS